MFPHYTIKVGHLHCVRSRHAVLDVANFQSHVRHLEICSLDIHSTHARARALAHIYILQIRYNEILFSKGYFLHKIYILLRFNWSCQNVGNTFYPFYNIYITYESRINLITQVGCNLFFIICLDYYLNRNNVFSFSIQFYSNSNIT